MLSKSQDFRELSELESFLAVTSLQSSLRDLELLLHSLSRRTLMSAFQSIRLRAADQERLALLTLLSQDFLAGQVIRIDTILSRRRKALLRVSFKEMRRFTDEQEETRLGVRRLQSFLESQKLGRYEKELDYLRNKKEMETKLALFKLSKIEKLIRDELALTRPE